MKHEIALRDWIANEIQDAGTHWSVGTFGALAEFSRDAGEPASVICDAIRCEATTTRGGIRIGSLENVRPVAYETTAKNPDQWGQAIALCLPDTDCTMNRRTVLTEITQDALALREEDREGFLFDLGLGTLQVDVCVRASDPVLLCSLRAGAGMSLFDPKNPAMKAILDLSPHRVFIARIGRAEVYQPIPSADQQSPNGPHTHLLPKLLRTGQSHSAANPIPRGFVPCAHLYPAHPTKDVFGRQKAFDRNQHGRYQELMKAFADSELMDLKRRVIADVRAGKAPEELTIPDGRFARAAIRIALRQINALDGPSPCLRKWRLFYDRVGDDAADEDEQMQHA